MNSKKFRFVEDFLNNKNIFFEELTEEGFFSKEMFERYSHTIYELSKEELPLKDKYNLIVIVWEISFKLESFIGRHKDPNDFVTIENLSNEELHKIGDVLYYTANWLSYNKPIEERLTKINGWKH